jgi:NADPH:quinone reductase-like Zn-dependent oxidoreductase
LKSLGANIVLDYKDPNIATSLKAAVGETPLRHIFDCVGVDASTLTLLESLLSPQGKLLSSVPPKAAPKCRFDMCAAGIIHELSDFNLPGSRLNSMLGKPNPDAAKKLQSAVQWALDNVGGKYIPPRVRRLRGRGLYDALEAFELMRRGEISGEKVVYKMSETPEIIDGDVGL